VERDPILVQSAFAIPMTLGLVVYTLLRRDRSRLHLLLAALLGSVALWVASLAVGLAATAPALRSLALDVQFLSSALMPPLFVVTMGQLVRSPLFERSPAAAIALSSLFVFFAVAYLSNGQHHLMIRDRQAALAALPPARWAGPLYWGQQIWVLLCDAAGVSFCVGAAWRGRTAVERRRAAMVIAAVVVPVLAHLVYLLHLLPIDFTLAPGALGLTAIFFVQGVHRYGLLEAQPMVRHDVLEYVHDGLLLADREGLVLDANAAAEFILGDSRAALRGRPLAEVMSRLDFDDAAALGARIASLPLDGGSLSGEVRTGDERCIEIVAGAVSAKGSLPAGRFVTLRDRSAQRRSERLLRERQRLESVGILAAGVAHEVNNPLAYVRANLAHLQSMAPQLEKYVQVQDDGAGAELLEIPDLVSESLDGLERIGRVVQGLLRFSRVPDDATRLVDMNEVVEQALRLAALQRGSRVRVERSLAPTLPPVLGSADRLVQVLVNLFLNAKQALTDQPDGRIVTETSVDGGSVLVRVRDEGPGIPEEHRDRIFDPFFTTRPPDQGTGLGLSIAFDIVREHHGTLELDPSAAGTCFSIRLPAAPEP
jgi:PAS domain S-box-containing protein